MHFFHSWDLVYSNVHWCKAKPVYSCHILLSYNLIENSFFVSKSIPDQEKMSLSWFKIDLCQSGRYIYLLILFIL